MIHPRKTALVLSVGLAVLLGGYAEIFPSTQNPRVLAPAGSIWRLDGDHPSIRFSFGANGSESHLSGAWRSDSPILVLYCPTGKECVYILPGGFHGFCSATVDLYLPGAYTVGFGPWGHHTANVTFTAPLQVELQTGPSANLTFHEGPGNSVVGCRIGF